MTATNTEPITLDPDRTALVLIDLQREIVAAPTGPHHAKDIITRATSLAAALRAAGGLVVLVRVDVGPNGALLVQPRTDFTPPGHDLPDGWNDFVPEFDPTPTDIVVTKYQWGAFHGTDLDLQLRRRSIGTIILGGISTHVGVESTARNAYEHGYEQLFAEDAMTDHDPDAHLHTVQRVLPRLGRVRTTRAILDALAE